MDSYSFLVIYNRTAKELNNLFNELVRLDKELTSLQEMESLSSKDNEKYTNYTLLGQSYYERFSFLEDKIKVLNIAKDKKNITTSKNNSEENNTHEDLFNSIRNLENNNFDL